MVIRMVIRITTSYIYKVQGRTKSKKWANFNLKGAYWIIQRFLVHYQILHLSNIAKLLPIKLSLFKAIAKRKGKIISLSRS